MATIFLICSVLVITNTVTTCGGVSKVYLATAAGSAIYINQYTVVRFSKFVLGGSGNGGL